MPEITDQPRLQNRHGKVRTPHAIDIGTDSMWANPFKPRRHGDCESVYEQFDLWVRHGSDLAARKIRNNIFRLVDQDLICDCLQGPCHGQILMQLAEEARVRLPRATRSLRVTLPVGDPVTTFGIAVAGDGPDALVVGGGAAGRWMTGKTLAEVTYWVRSREGNLMCADEVRARVAALGQTTSIGVRRVRQHRAAHAVSA